MTVGDYLLQQDSAELETAHDGYAALAYGMVNAAVHITKLSGSSLTQLAEYFSTIRKCDLDARAKQLTPLWLDALTIPAIDATLPAATFIAQHGQALAMQFQHIFLNDPAPDALMRAAQTYLLLGLHLSVAVGADADVMATLITTPTT
jgi:hypothetical protein